MAMSEATLQSNLLSLFDEMGREPMDGAEYARRLAQIITAHVRAASVTVDPGIPVTTPAGPGATNAPGTGRLS